MVRCMLLLSLVGVCRAISPQYLTPWSSNTAPADAIEFSPINYALVEPSSYNSMYVCVPGNFDFLAFDFRDPPVSFASLCRSEKKCQEICEFPPNNTVPDYCSLSPDTLDPQYTYNENDRDAQKLCLLQAETDCFDMPITEPLSRPPNLDFVRSSSIWDSVSSQLPFPPDNFTFFTFNYNYYTLQWHVTFCNKVMGHSVAGGGIANSLNNVYLGRLPVNSLNRYNQLFDNSQYLYPNNYTAGAFSKYQSPLDIFIPPNLQTSTTLTTMTTPTESTTFSLARACCGCDVAIQAPVDLGNNVAGQIEDNCCRDCFVPGGVGPNECWQPTLDPTTGTVGCHVSQSNAVLQCPADISRAGVCPSTTTTSMTTTSTTTTGLHTEMVISETYVAMPSPTFRLPNFTVLDPPENAIREPCLYEGTEERICWCYQRSTFPRPIVTTSVCESECNKTEHSQTFQLDYQITSNPDVALYSSCITTTPLKFGSTTFTDLISPRDYGIDDDHWCETLFAHAVHRDPLSEIRLGCLCRTPNETVVPYSEDKTCTELCNEEAGLSTGDSCHGVIVWPPEEIDGSIVVHEPWKSLARCTCASIQGGHLTQDTCDDECGKNNTSTIFNSNSVSLCRSVPSPFVTHAHISYNKYYGVDAMTSPTVSVGFAVCVPPLDPSVTCPGNPVCQLLSVQGGLLPQYSSVADLSVFGPNYIVSTSDHYIPTCEAPIPIDSLATKFHKYATKYETNINYTSLLIDINDVNQCNLATATPEDCVQLAAVFNDVYDNPADSMPRSVSFFDWCSDLGTNGVFPPPSPPPPPLLTLRQFSSIFDVATSDSAPLSCASEPHNPTEVLAIQSLLVDALNTNVYDDPCLCNSFDLKPIVDPRILGLITPGQGLPVPGNVTYFCENIPICNSTLTYDDHHFLSCACNDSSVPAPFSFSTCDEACNNAGKVCESVYANEYYYNVDQVVFSVPPPPPSKTSTNLQLVTLLQGSVAYPPLAILGYTTTTDGATIFAGSHENNLLRYTRYEGTALDLTELFRPKSCSADGCHSTIGSIIDTADNVELCQFRCLTITPDVTMNSKFKLQIQMPVTPYNEENRPVWAVGQSDFPSVHPIPDQVCTNPLSSVVNLKHLPLMARSLYHDRLIQVRHLIDALGNTTTNVTDYHYWASWVNIIQAPLNPDVEFAPCITTVIHPVGQYVPSFTPGTIDTYLDYLVDEEESPPGGVPSGFTVFHVPADARTLLEEVLTASLVAPNYDLLYPRGRFYAQNTACDGDNITKHDFVSTLLEIPDFAMLVTSSSSLKQQLVGCFHNQPIHYFLELTPFGGGGASNSTDAGPVTDPCNPIDENHPCCGPSQQACEDITAQRLPSGVYENATCTNYPLCGFRRRLPTDAPTRALRPNELTLPPTQVDGSTAAVVGVNRDAFLGSISAAIAVLAVTFVVVTAVRLHRERRDGGPREDYDSDTDDEDSQPLLPPPYSANPQSTAAFM